MTRPNQLKKLREISQELFEAATMPGAAPVVIAVHFENVLQDCRARWKQQEQDAQAQRRET